MICSTSFDMEPTIQSASGAPIPAPRPMRDGFEFQDVSFCLSGRRTPVLQDVSFRLERARTWP